MKYIVDIKGEIEGDYEIIGKYEERLQGEWIYKYKTCKCSVCGFETVIDVYNYCPMCGADMRGDDNDKEETT